MALPRDTLDFACGFARYDVVCKLSQVIFHISQAINATQIITRNAACHFDDTNGCRLPQQGRVSEFAYINASTKAATHRHVRGVAPLRGMLGMFAPTSCIRCGEQPHLCSPTAVWTSVDSTKRGSALRLRATDTARVVGNRW